MTNVNLATVNGQGALTWATNWGRFVLASSPGVGNNPLSVTAADVNGDGKLDLISANYNANTLSVLTNDGSGGFVLASSPGVGNRPVSITAADVNGDGGVDLISANYGDNTLSVLFNTLNTPAYVGRYAGDGSGLTSLNADALVGGLTINLKVLVPGGFTNTLCFTNGVLRAVR